jgi:hypothetical protein
MDRITPKDIGTHVPDWATESWSELITEKYDGSRAIVNHGDVQQRFESHITGSYKKYQNYGYSYRDNGWKL